MNNLERDVLLIRLCLLGPPVLLLLGALIYYLLQ